MDCYNIVDDIVRELKETRKGRIIILIRTIGGIVVNKDGKRDRTRFLEYLMHLRRRPSCMPCRTALNNEGC